MAPHSSVLAWRIPWMGEPGGLPSMGSHRVGHDWSDLAAAAAAASCNITNHMIYLLCFHIFSVKVFPLALNCFSSGYLMEINVCSNKLKFLNMIQFMFQHYEGIAESLSRTLHTGFCLHHIIQTAPVEVTETWFGWPPSAQITRPGPQKVVCGYQGHIEQGLV